MISLEKHTLISKQDEMNRQVILKTNAPFISCISKINGVLVENAEVLDVIAPLFCRLKYSKNYSKTKEVQKWLKLLCH